MSTIHLVKLGLATLALAIVAGGCDLATKHTMKPVPPEKAAEQIERNLDYYGRHLLIGMSKSEALRILPTPQNTNTENVCVWVGPSTELIVTTNRLDWQWLQATRGGYFMVFVDNKIATPLCANAALNPWQALQKHFGLTLEQAEDILGSSSGRTSF
jgi:hypothetical protein